MSDVLNFICDFEHAEPGCEKWRACMILTLPGAVVKNENAQNDYMQIEISACLNLSTTFPLLNFCHIKYTSSVLKFLITKKFVLVSIGYYT